MLASPGREWHVLQLVSPDAGPVPDGDAGYVLDDAAIRSYRDRLLDLREYLDDAEAAADTGRVERARANGVHASPGSHVPSAVKHIVSMPSRSTSSAFSRTSCTDCTAWAEQDFCGGTGGSSCTAPVREKLLVDPF